MLMIIYVFIYLVIMAKNAYHPAHKESSTSAGYSPILRSTYLGGGGGGIVLTQNHFLCHPPILLYWLISGSEIRRRYLECRSVFIRTESSVWHRMLSAPTLSQLSLERQD